MKSRQSLQELLKVLEEIRSKDFPDVPKDLVEQIAISQYNNQDDRNKSRTETMNIIAEYVNKIGNQEE